MSKREPKTGADKHRAVDAIVSEQRWRDAGGPLTADGKSRTEREDQQLQLAIATILDIPMPATASGGNEIATGLFAIAASTDNPIFWAALEEMSRLGLDGADWYDRLSLPDLRGLVDAVTANAVRAQQRAAGISREAALERTAVQLNVPASSFAGAKQEVKRRVIRAKKRAG